MQYARTPTYVRTYEVITVLSDTFGQYTVARAVGRTVVVHVLRRAIHAGGGR